MMRKYLSALALALSLGLAPAWAQDDAAAEPAVEAVETMEAVAVEAPVPVEETVADETAEEAVSVEQKTTELAYALDTFYFLVFGVLVMWMAAGFAMLESGLVRSKNTAEILTKNIGLFAIASVTYMLFGYNFMYPGDAAMSPYFPGLGGVLGSGDNEVAGVMAGDSYYSGLADFFFQVVFVGAAMSIVSGAVAERMKLVSFFIFAIFMTSFIYPLQGYWKWGGGFLDAAGFSDFAGSGVVHMTGATAALAGVILLGARRGKYGPDGKINPIPGANLPIATLGTFILWMGWFGFNGGSELIISNVAEANAVSLVLVNTNLAASGGLIAAMLTSLILFKKTDLTMVLNGALAGLVAITAEPLAPSPLAAALIGAVGGVIVVFSILGLDKLKIDDPVGAISVHGTVGMWGVMAVPLTNADATFGAQLLGLVTILGFVFVASFVVWLVIKLVIGIRVSPEEEDEGVDISQCGLEAYPEFTK